MRPTEEQINAVELFLTKDALKVNAFAGTGKTSTLRLMAKADSRKGVYLAFNKSIAAVASESFPKTVQALTSHSIAYRSVIQHGYSSEKMVGKLNVNALAERLALAPLEIDGVRILTKREFAYLILETIKRFCQSADRQIEAKHVPMIGALAFFHNSFNLHTLKSSVSQSAQKTWIRMTTAGDAGFPLGHDGYFKLWSLSQPKISADYILLDEAQDSNPALLSVLTHQRSQVIYVGDRFQQIYQWRGAVNAMEEIETKHSTQLTQSFRFGPAIADVANKILSLLDPSAVLRGLDTFESSIGCSNPDAILSRTNGSLVGYVLAAETGGRSIHVVGGTQELTWMLNDVTALKESKPATHSEFFGYKTWHDVQEASQKPEGEHLKTFVKIVDTHGERSVLRALARSKSDEREADLVLSTAHKAKGREWSAVMLDDDFFEPYRVPPEHINSKERTKPLRSPVYGPIDGELYDYSPEEARLLYVATTRARKEVQMPQWCSLFFGISQNVQKMKLAPKVTPVSVEAPHSTPQVISNSEEKQAATLSRDVSSRTPKKSGDSGLVYVLVFAAVVILIAMLFRTV